jgi:hypothetical protein
MSLTTGNAVDRGNLSVARNVSAGVSGSVYGHFGGGYTGSDSNVIDYIDLNVIDVVNAVDRGNLSVSRHTLGGV